MIQYKKTLLMVLITICFISKGFSTGVGVIIGANRGIIYPISETNKISQDDYIFNIEGSIRSGRLPLVIGFGFEIENEDNFSFGTNTILDYWIIDTQIYNTWSFYTGTGLKSDFLIVLNDGWKMGIGPRLFSGVNFTILDGAFEFFAQLNIQPVYYVTSQNTNYFLIQLPLEYGMRFHF